ncbi:MAG TPA: hypothetical protein VHE60_00100 [Pyrinomonadaceae bacterium]|nr:hypothetical protein [Pyrinomonadaceae bacterium]
MKRIGKRILIVSVVWVAFGSMPFVRSEALSISQTADSIQWSVIAFLDGPVRLGSGSARVTLEPVAEANTERRTLAARIEALARGRHIYLVVRDLRVVGQPGVLFRLYLDLPSDAKPIRTDPHYVGALNFFNAAEAGRFDAPNEKSPMFVSYDITRVLRNLRAQKLLSDQTTVTIIPTGTPAIGSDPRIGRIEIIEQ